MSNLPTFTVSSEQPMQLSHQINPVLTQDNYLIWKSQVLPFLRGHGLTAFVDGSKAPPSEQIQVGHGENLPNQAFNQWLQQDQLILAWMFRSISPPILAQVIDCESSHQLWQRLQQMLSTQSTAPLVSQNTFSNDQPGSSSTWKQGRGSFRGKGKGKGGGSGSNSDKSIQCQICLQRGHDAGKCYRRFDNLDSDEPPQQIQNTLQECKYSFQEVDPDAHADYVSCVSFSSSAWPPVFITGSWDRTVKVWNAVNLKLCHTLRGHKGRVKAVAISPDGSLCASGGDSCVILLWDLAEGKRLYSLDAGAFIHALCFCPNRYWLAVCSEISVQIWDLESKVMQDFKLDDRPRKWKNHYCTRLDWSTDGNTLFTGYSDGAIRVWCVTGGNY